MGQILKHDIANDVVAQPRAKAFLAHLRQLVKAVVCVDRIIELGEGRR